MDRIRFSISLVLLVGLFSCFNRPQLAPINKLPPISKLPPELAQTLASQALGEEPTANGVQEVQLNIYPTVVLHPSNPHVLGLNRNHVEADIRDKQKKLGWLRSLRPNWGENSRLLYRIGHGPTDGRSDYSYMPGYHFEKHFNQIGPYPYDDIRFGLQDTEELDADAIHVINVGTGSPEEAARYVKYVTEEDNNPRYPFRGRGAYRFELGNEIGWKVVKGFFPSEMAYGKRALEFIKAMRAATSQTIEIGVVGSINSNWMGNGWSGGGKQVKNLADIVGDAADFVIYHGYPSWPLENKNDLQAQMAQIAWNENKISKEIKPAIAGTHWKIANTEYSLNMYGRSDLMRGTLGALYSLDSIIMGLKYDLYCAVAFCMVHQNKADELFFNDKGDPAPLFYLYQLLSKHWGGQVVRSQLSQINPITVRNNHPDSVVSMMPITTVSSIDSQGQVYTLLYNRTPNTAYGITLSGMKPQKAYVFKGERDWTSPQAEILELDYQQQRLKIPGGMAVLLIGEGL
jgi:hypothetical protein